MKTIKIETTIKNIMNSFLNENGINDADTTTSTNDRILVVAPNRFGYGYVTLVLKAGGVWNASFNKNTRLGTPKLQPNSSHGLDESIPTEVRCASYFQPSEEEVATIASSDEFRFHIWEFFDTLAVCAGYLLSEDPNQYSFIADNFTHVEVL